MKAIIFTGYERTGGLERVSGAYRLATVLRREGWDIEVVDFFYRWSLDQLKELIKSRNAASSINWIGFSCTWINYASTEFQSRINDFLIWVKQNYPDIITMAGGHNPSLHFPMYDNVDYIVAGYGEVAVPAVLKYIYGNGKIKGIPRKNGWYVDGNTFYPAWPISDLSIEYEYRDFIHPGETLALEFSRGCKFSCAFCNFPILGVKEDTTRDLKILEAELKRNYDQYGVTNYQVADETLNDRDEKLAKIGKIVKDSGIDFNFNAFIRADILFSRPQQLELLAEAGVWGHYYGIESFNHESAKAVGKGMHPDKIKQGLIDTEKYFDTHLGKFRGTVSLIYGLPHETPQTILDGLDWLETHWRRQSVIAFPLNINLTGTKSKIDNDYEKYGYRIIKEEKQEKLYNRHNFFPNDIVVWENDHMDMYDAINLVNRQLGKDTTSNIFYQSRIKTFSGRWMVDSWQLWGLMGVQKDMNLDLRTVLNLPEMNVVPIRGNVVNYGNKLDTDRSDLDLIHFLKIKDSMQKRSSEIRDEYIRKKLSL